MASLPYVTSDERAKSRLVTRAGAEQAALASLLSVVILFVLVSAAEFIVTLVLFLAVAVVLARWFHRRAGGITGDFLGATQQVLCWTVLAVLAYFRL